MDKELFAQKLKEWGLVQKRAKQLRASNPNFNFFQAQSEAYKQLISEGEIS